MGQEIVYCFRCSSRIVGADLDKGTAVQIGNRTCCQQCLPAVLAELPATEREAILARMTPAKGSHTQPPTRRTPRGGVEAAPQTPRGGHPAVVSTSNAPSRMPMIAGAGAVGLALLAWLALGNSSTPPPQESPSPRPVIAETPPPPESPSRDKIAREAVAKARDGERAGLDIDLQVLLWEEAVSKSERTPSSDEATQGRATVLIKRKEVHAQELSRILEGVDGLVRQDEFKKAIEALQNARKRRDLPDWTQSIDRKMDVVRKAEADGGSYQQSSEADGLVCMEAERFHSKVDKDHHQWTLVTAPPGFQGKGAMAALPNTNTGVKDFVSDGCRMDYRIRFVKTGKHYVWVRGFAETGNDDSIHVGLDGKDVKSSTAMSVAIGKWGWTSRIMANSVSTLEIADPGIHTLNIWMREDGAVIDRILLTTNPKYAPKDAGPPESSR